MTVNLERCHLGDEADCLNEWGMQVLRREPVDSCRAVHHAHSGHLIGEAALSFATLRGSRKVLADRTTGQLYDAGTLKCLSGPLKLEDKQ